MSKKKTHEEFCQQVFDLVKGEYEVISIYDGNKIKVKFRHNCDKCNNYEFSMIPSDFLRGNRCCRCSKKERLTDDMVRMFMKNIGYQLISDKYINRNQKLIFKDYEGYYYYAIINNMRSGHVPLRFAVSNPYTVQNIKLWCKLNNKAFELTSETYNNSNEYLEWKCLKGECGEVFKATWTSVISNIGCGYCTGQRVGITNCLATKNPKLAKEWHFTKNGDLTPYDFTVCSGQYVWWKCEECEHEWETIIANRNKGSGCPKCCKSKGEKAVSTYLKNKSFTETDDMNYNLLKNINQKYYIHQKKFDNLRGINNGLLSYDFYLPNYNLLIEYQGQFHDGTTNCQTIDGIQRQKEHDERKREYAQKNNIKLLEIWYWDFNNIEQILTNSLA